MLKQMGTLNLIRCCLYCIVFIQLLIFSGIINVPGNGISLYWLVYVFGAILIFFETPLFLSKNSPELQEHFKIAGMFFLIDLLFDAIGSIFNLFALTWWYDDIMHALFLPFFITAFSVFVLKVLLGQAEASVGMFKKCLLIFCIALSLLSIHEVFEYSIDIISNSNSGTGATDIYDTSRDLAYDTIGISIFLVFYAMCRNKA